MLKDPDVLFVDVRSRAEVAFLGLPKRADKNIPYMEMPVIASYNSKSGTYDLEIKPDFSTQFKSFMESRGAGLDASVILMCRSGTRGAKAADLLADMGYTHVYSMIDGFEGDKANDGEHTGQRVVNGWRNAGFAWSYKIAESQVYEEDL